MADENVSDKAASAVKGKMSSLEGTLGKHAEKLPKMSESNRKMFANFLPWGMGAFGVLALVWAKDLWDGLRALDAVEGLGEAFGGLGSLVSAVTPSKTSMWIAIVMFGLIGLAIGWGFFRGAMKKTRASWLFFFYSATLAVLAGLFYVFFLSELGSSRGWLTLVAGLFGMYLLFQTKNSYNS